MEKFSHNYRAALLLTVLILGGLFLTVSVLNKDTNTQSNAASVNAVEPENGTLAGNVTVVDDSTASGGKYVRFGNNVSISPTPTLTPIPLRTFYVSPTGNDSNPGTLAAPWRSFCKVTQTVRAGDMAIFQDGTYTTSQYCWLDDNARNGTAANPIVLKAQNKHQAKLLFSGLPNEKIYITIDYVTIQDFEITATAPGTTTLDKLVNCYGNTHCSMIGNLAHGVYEECFKAFDSSYLLIEGNTCYNVTHEGIDVLNSYEGVIRNNYIYDVGRIGILAKGGVRNYQVYNNLVQSKTKYMDDSGIALGGVSGSSSVYDFSSNGHEAYNSVAWNNIILSDTPGNINYGMRLMGSITSAAVNNVVIGARTGLNIAMGGDPSNACGSGNGCVAWTATSVNPTYKNNSITDCTVAATRFNGLEAGSNVDYNLFNNCPTAPTQAHGVTGDPLFVNRLTDWHLLPGSPAIGTGVVLSPFTTYTDANTPVSPAIDVSKDREGKTRTAPWEIGVYDQ